MNRSIRKAKNIGNTDAYNGKHFGTQYYNNCLTQQPCFAPPRQTV